jgi:periplasmic divalent cation tolerance protein
MPLDDAERTLEPAHVKTMKAGKKVGIVLVTAPEMKTARRLARAALEGRLAACANLVPGVESHYWWQGRISKATEVLIVLKTTAGNLAALERLIVAEHPYDTPEFVALPVARVNHRYLSWWNQSVG